MAMKIFKNLIALLCLIVISACDKSDTPSYPQVNREDKIPPDISKRGPSTDQHPPILYSTEFEEPVPVDYQINTAGAEDSPFILPDGKTLYFFFTPDVRVPAEQQLFDEVTGVWVSSKQNGSWTTPVRVWLQDPGKLSLEGAVCVQGNEMWFASAREGYTGVNMFTANGTTGNTPVTA